MQVYYRKVYAQDSQGGDRIFEFKLVTAMGRPLYEKYGFVSMEAEMELPMTGL